MNQWFGESDRNGFEKIPTPQALKSGAVTVAEVKVWNFLAFLCISGLKKWDPQVMAT